MISTSLLIDTTSDKEIFFLKDRKSFVKDVPFSSLLLQSTAEQAEFCNSWPQLWMNLIWLLITELISLVLYISGPKSLVPQDKVIVKKKKVPSYFL